MVIDSDAMRAIAFNLVFCGACFALELHSMLAAMETTTLLLPAPKIQARKVDMLLAEQVAAQGLHPLLARIIAARPLPDNFDLHKMLTPKLNNLDHPFLMQDMERASDRIARAILQKEVIGIETDHDCDGQTSHAVLFYNLVHKFKHPTELIRSYIGHRLNEGYGLSLPVAQRILQDDPRPSLIITADNGSADEARIALLAAEGIDVIVSDHHQLPLAGPPASAFACLNPSRADCKYPDPFIAGCMVAWLLMSATRLTLIKAGYLPADFDKLSDSLDFVAVGTVADCVSMARSYNNRAVVRHGLQIINAETRACWRAIKAHFKDLVNRPFTVEDLGFKVGPLLNSDGRLASAFGSVGFLLATDYRDAVAAVRYLHNQNTQRKQIQAAITQQGLHIAAAQAHVGKFSLCVFLADGHAGVHGISASRIRESFGRTTVFLAPKQSEPGVITGSIRGSDGVHVGDALQWIIQHNPNLLLAGGGHIGAGGVTLVESNLEQFAQQFESAVQQQLTAAALGPVIWTDGALPAHFLTIDVIDLLAQLEPYGREFEAPVFEIFGVLTSWRLIGDGTHARLELDCDGRRISGVWFNFPASVSGDEWVGEQVGCVASLRVNEFGGARKCELQVAWLINQIV